jgi:predicted Fe-Mo cluster-binding NifX family protein
MKYQIAIASQNKREVTGHAGKCSRFLVYTIDDDSVTSKEWLELQKEDLFYFRFHHSEEPFAPHPLFGMKAILTGGSGPGFTRNLAHVGVKTYNVMEKDPDEAVAHYLLGDLQVMEAPESRSCHDHEH